jgi:pimeloyl-ACP methyl ester carboxylesterase
MGMERAKAVVRNVKTPSGQISYAEAGSGPVALFVHGVLLNKHLWRRQMTGCRISASASRLICSRMAIPRSRPTRTSP